MDQAEFSALKLAREGFGGGDPAAIMEMRADWVLHMIEFLQFETEYGDTYRKLNAPK
jgi:hypothetical protein